MNKLRLLPVMLSVCISGNAFAADKIEHTEHVYYDMKSGEENVYTLEVNNTNEHIDVLMAEVSPALKPYSEFHFLPCLKENGQHSASFIYHLDASNVEPSDSHLLRLEHYLKVRNLDLKLIKLKPGLDLLFMSQNGMLITLNSIGPFDKQATCAPPSSSGE